jgi:endonuclease G
MAKLRRGYDEGFLGDGIKVPMPTVSLELTNDVLRREELRDGCIVDYIHYSLVFSESNRQAFFSAANLDQKKYQSVEGRDWFLDPRIGLDCQIGPEAYSKNDWDRGHLTRRTAITWGTKYQAKRASNDSCSYANASLQHMNFNQDEWRVPEEVVRHFKRDKNDRLCVFTGPVFTVTDRWYTRPKLEHPARIPSGFWKIVAYIGKQSGKLECQAYVMYQDAHFIADKRGRHRIKIKNYQVTITELEHLTGLEFPESLFQSNPLYFYPHDQINDGPESFEAPSGLTKKQLDRGVVFTRREADSKAFQPRRNVIKEKEFAEYVEKTRCL